jgi:hypothetical protein
MKFVEYDIEQVALHRYKKTDNMKLLDEFSESGLACAKVEEYTQRDAHICAASLRKTALHAHMSHIKVIVRKGEVYMINELIVNKQKK